MILLLVFCFVIICTFYWLSYISYNHPIEWLVGVMPSWYYIKKKDYIGLNNVIEITRSIDFKPDIIKYNDIDDVCRVVKNAASERYPTLSNEQVIDDIKFLYRNGIYVEVWNSMYSNHIYVPYKSVQKYVENPTTSCEYVVMAEKEFLEICEKLKKENAYVK